MHGDPNFLKKFPFIGGYLADTARDHLDHHKSVYTDMYLKKNINTHSLFFSWSLCLMFTFVMMAALKLTTSLDTTKLILLAVIISIGYCALWNNIHTDMHGYDKQVSLSDGFPNYPGLMSRGPLYRYLWKYHATHHIQKGDKTNFNIILPACDWLFGTYHNRDIDNLKHCEQIQHEDDRCHERQRFQLSDKHILPMKSSKDFL